jgi:hypothetical protein
MYYKDTNLGVALDDVNAEAITDVICCTLFNPLYANNEYKLRTEVVNELSSIYTKVYENGVLKLKKLE